VGYCGSLFSRNGGEGRRLEVMASGGIWNWACRRRLGSYCWVLESRAVAVRLWVVQLNRSIAGFLKRGLMVGGDGEYQERVVQLKSHGSTSLVTWRR